MTTSETNLSNSQISTLTGILTGATIARAASTNAALKRFLAAAANVPGAEDVLKMEYRDAYEAIIKLTGSAAAAAAPVEPAKDETMTNEDLPAFLRKTDRIEQIDAVAPPAPTTEATDILAEIARDHLHIETLEIQGSDSADFHDLSVSRIRAALDAAYEAGRAAAAAEAPTKAARAPRAARTAAATTERGPNKREIAAALLTRPEGTTAKEILDATGWPAVSVPAIAKASKLALRQTKDGKATRYFGTAR